MENLINSKNNNHYYLSRTFSEKLFNRKTAPSLKKLFRPFLFPRRFFF